MNIILKDKGIVIPEEDVKYLEEVKKFYNCDLEGFKEILYDEFVGILSAVIMLSGDPILLPNGKTIQLMVGEAVEKKV